MALTTEIAITAAGWTDDVEDLPLRYAFAYRPQSADANGAGVSTSLGKQSVVASTSWLPPAVVLGGFCLSAW